MEYIIVDAETSACRAGFSSRDEAYEFIIAHMKPGDNYEILSIDNYEEEMEIHDGSMKLMIVPVEIVENIDEADIILREGNWCLLLDKVAEYHGDLLSNNQLACMDILESPDVALKCYK